MYLNFTGNVHAVCSAVTKPEYREEAGERRVEMTKVVAKCKEMTPDGMQTVSLQLLFFEALAIPAMKIDVGSVLVIDGRETSKEFFSYGKHRLERTLVVEDWHFRDIDPGGILEELKERKGISQREHELRKLFAELLTQARPAIIAWVRKELGLPCGETAAETPETEKKEDE